MPANLVLGTAQFGLDYGIANRDGMVPEAEVRRILALAAEHGVRQLDTAAGYGESEAVLGRALGDLGLRDHFSIVTKTVPAPEGVPPGEGAALIRAGLKRSRERLGVDSLFACLLHREGDFVPYFDVLRAAKAAGEIRHAGVSLDSRAGLAAPVRDGDLIQLPLNMLDRRFEDLLDKTCDGPLIHARSAFLQGLLLMDPAATPEPLRALRPALERFEALRREAGLEREVFHLRYVLGRPGVGGVVIGVNTAAQLAANIAAAEQGPLPHDLLARVEAARGELAGNLAEELIRPRCWGAWRR